jgi:hypothetical protein
MKLIAEESPGFGVWAWCRAGATPEVTRDGIAGGPFDRAVVVEALTTVQCRTGGFAHGAKDHNRYAGVAK